MIEEGSCSHIATSTLERAVPTSCLCWIRDSCRWYLCAHTWHQIVRTAVRSQAVVLFGLATDGTHVDPTDIVVRFAQVTMADESKTVDENLYSRQIGVYGISTMKKLMGLKVLIVGLKGVGIETAKNLILAGPAAVSVFDPEPATVQDLATNVRAPYSMII